MSRTCFLYRRARFSSAPGHSIPFPSSPYMFPVKGFLSTMETMPLAYSAHTLKHENSCSHLRYQSPSRYDLCWILVLTTVSLGVLHLPTVLPDVRSAWEECAQDCVTNSTWYEVPAHISQRLGWPGYCVSLPSDQQTQCPEVS